MTAAYLIPLLMAQPEALPTAELELVVVQDDVPISGARLLIDETELGKTDELGSLVATIPAGRRSMRVVRGDAVLVEVDLLTDAGELVLIIASIKAGEPPELLIESSGGDSVLASESDQSPEERIQSKKDNQPPGALSGTVLSADGQDPIARAQLFFSGITIEVETNKAGQFSVELPAGVYSVSIVHPRFSSQTLENIRVIPERQVNLEIELTPAGVRLQDYVVTAPYVEGSIASVIEQQRAASGVSDVLGAAQISATGDSNAAQALTRVTGLTVEDGKFVLVRGQPSRFTLALFNGSPLPSPEPLQQVVPLDLFPTGILEGIEVQKSYTANKPGSFGAGLVELNTIGIPAESFLKFSASTSVNDISAFQDGRSYDGGTYDFLGFDDGTRELPAEIAQATENGTVSLNNLPDEEAASAGQSFPNILDLDDRTLPPDLSLSIAGGTSIPLPSDGVIGFVATGGYRNQWRQQERIQRGFEFNGEILAVEDDLRESRTDNDVTLSGLLTAAATWDNHEFRSNTFIVQQTQQRSQLVTGQRVGSGQLVDVRSSLLSYIERSLVAQQLLGRHDFEYFQIAYRGLIAQAQRDAPDRREYTYQSPPGRDLFNVEDPTGLTREFSFVDDSQYSFGVDLSTDLFADEKDFFRVTPSLGVAYRQTDRNAGAQTFFIQPERGTDRTDPPETLFDPRRIPAGELELTDLSLFGGDDYTGDATIQAVYVRADFGIGDLARLVLGVRQESADYFVETLQLAVPTLEPIESGFDETNLLPAGSLTVFVLDDVQIRAAYGKTVSRPLFNELSPSLFVDPDSGQQFLGNENLVQTEIEGYDVRAEWYPSTTESLSFGVFLKDYTNPLERTFLPDSGGAFTGTFQNADEARVTGIEFGGRVELGRLRELFDVPSLFDSIYLSANAAFLDSEVTLAEAGVATSTIRPLEGQADLVINGQLGLDTDEHDLTIAYNRVGRRLRQVGVFNQPDVFQDPLDVLDINYSWSLDGNWTLKASASNLFNARVRLTQQRESQEPVVWREFQRGRGFGVGLVYAL